MIKIFIYFLRKLILIKQIKIQCTVFHDRRGTVSKIRNMLYVYCTLCNYSWHLWFIYTYLFVKYSGISCYLSSLQTTGLNRVPSTISYKLTCTSIIIINKHPCRLVQSTILAFLPYSCSYIFKVFFYQIWLDEFT